MRAHRLTTDFDSFGLEPVNEAVLDGMGAEADAAFTFGTIS